MNVASFAWLGRSSSDLAIWEISDDSVSSFSFPFLSFGFFFFFLNDWKCNEQYSYSTLFFLYKNVVFPVQAEYSYFSADFRLKIFLYYS